VGAGGNKINYAKRLNNQARPFIVMTIFFFSVYDDFDSVHNRKKKVQSKKEEGKSFGSSQFVLLKITTKFTTGDCRNSTLFFFSTLPSRAERERDTKWLYANEGKTACATGSPVS
jgi:hypothetical protein